MEFGQLKVANHLLRQKRNVYLDYNATTPVSRPVRRTMRRVLKLNYGNPSSVYQIAQKSAQVLEKARQDVANAIHADQEEIYFTGCASESNNTILKSLGNLSFPGKNKIISSPVEHPSVMKTLEFLQTRGIKVEFIPVDRKGLINPEDLKSMIDEKTFLVCCMLANNETGTIQDLTTITEIAHSKGVPVMSDCVQALGKIPVNVKEMGINYASFSAHKLYGPKGAGALYVRKDSPIIPFIHGGHQESGMRAGTESVHNIAGFGRACKDTDRLVEKSKHTRKLKDQFIRGIKSIYPQCIVNSPENSCLPNTISITFPGIDNSGLMAMLDFHGVAVSAGSACSMPENNPSHVLKALGLSEKAAQETLRISLGSLNTVRDIRYALKIFKRCIEGRTLSINILKPSQLNESLLFDKETYILDVRPSFMRNQPKSLPNAHLASFFSISNFLDQLPKNKHILVVCQHGNLSYLTTYYLRSKGFKQVSTLLSGLTGWKRQFNELYLKYAGENIIAL